jgi:diguanylate cyclase (GGDEF)-like protein
LDGFKQINDQFGHLEGNRVLRRVADMLRKNCREYDYVARMGGDEFVIILSGCAQEELQSRIDMFAEIGRLAGYDIVGKDLLSMSIGHACYPMDGVDAEQLLAEADRRMYKAKNNPKSAKPVRSDLEKLTTSVGLPSNVVTLPTGQDRRVREAQQGVRRG